MTRTHCACPGAFAQSEAVGAWLVQLQANRSSDPRPEVVEVSKPSWHCMAVGFDPQKEQDTLVDPSVILKLQIEGGSRLYPNITYIIYIIYIYVSIHLKKYI